MSIRALALELYKATQKVGELKKKRATCDAKDQAAVDMALKAAEKEAQLLRRILDGEKESGAFRSKFNSPGSLKR